MNWGAGLSVALAIACGLQTTHAGPLQSATRTFAAIDRDVRSGIYGNVDRLYVSRGGKTLADFTYQHDYRSISRGRIGPIGCGDGCSDPSWMHHYNYFHPDFHPYFQGRNVHTLQSVTKSIAATVIGIALGRGEIKSLDQPFLDYFRDRDLSRVDSRLRQATIRDVLTMRTGIEWHESDRPLDDTNTTVQLEKSRDWTQFTLEQPMDAEPGSKWAYNSGSSQLLSGIIRNATGRFIDDYAREYLFAPLGIREFHWKRTPTDHPDTEGGLYLSADSLARIGELYLRDGEGARGRVLPEGWVKDATSRHVRAVGPGGAWDYGYQWWITTHDGVEVWAGRGFGGQLLLIVPARDTVAVVHAWNIFGNKAQNILRPVLEAVMTTSSARP
jgi:CubicO group peptidase (beta-lactamase class C family)